MKVAISLRLANDDWAKASAWVSEAERLGVDCVVVGRGVGPRRRDAAGVSRRADDTIKLGSGSSRPARARRP